MASAIGRIIELRLEGEGLVSARISCSAALHTAPGQYLLASLPGDGGVLPAPVFPARWTKDEFTAAPPLPLEWPAGAELSLRGPLGSGFHLPAQARRVALAALDCGEWRLWPLMDQALKQGADVALYIDGLPEDLPRAVEVLPLAQVSSAARWADYLAIDLPWHMLPTLRTMLGLESGGPCPCAAEALVLAAMPCGGLAECGVCAVETRRGWKLACKDGPVFDLNIL